MANSIPARLSTYTASAGRKFGLTVGIALAVLSAITRWRGHPTIFIVFASIGAALILAGLVVPTWLGPVDRAWMKLAHLISKVTTPVFMGVIYFIILTPIGFLRRRFAGSALVHRDGAHGVWLDRAGTPRSSLDRLF